MKPEDSKRLRFSVLLCIHGLRNLAYFRVGRQIKDHALLGDFMITVNNNFLDICVLEWCKLFGDKKAVHYWSKVVDDTAKYKPALLSTLGMDGSQFDGYINQMRKYRDKFVAHLERENVMRPPILDTAKASFAFHLRYLADMDSSGAVLHGLPLDPDNIFKIYDEQAKTMYSRFSSTAPLEPL